MNISLEKTTTVMTFSFITSKENLLKKIKETNTVGETGKIETPWFDIFLNYYYLGRQLGDTSLSFINSKGFLKGKNKINLILKEKGKKMYIILSERLSKTKIIVREIFEFNGDNIEGYEAAFSFVYPFTKNILTIGE